MTRSDRLHTEAVSEWPPLAWLTVVRPGDPAISVFHGTGVEATDEWVCEAVWDGPYEDGGFDATDVVAGTGIRLRGNDVAFVSSGSTVDRLQWARYGTASVVSNSLTCLFVAIGGELDPSYPDYYSDFRTIVDGLTRYKRDLATSAGRVELVYFDNLHWTGSELHRVPKPESRERFAGFEDYRTFLASALERVASNAADPARGHPFAMLTTCSSGYDSPAVSVLAAEAGCRDVLAFERARNGENDSGEAIAAALGLRPIRVARAAWKCHRLPEIPFLAANAYGEEVHYRGAEEELAGRVLLTGYHGDKVWNKETSDVRGELIRSDPSGLSLTEYRLSANFLHAPIPFWGARRVRDVVAISNSDEMHAWDVGGAYSRPIPRRIVETAGIERGSFGVSKRATSVLLHNEPQFLTDESLERYLAWLRLRRREWIRHGRIPPLLSPTLDGRIAAASVFVGERLPNRLHGAVASRIRRPAPADARRRGSTARASVAIGPPRTPARAARRLARRTLRFRYRPVYLRRFVFGWAVSELAPFYESASRIFS